MDSLLFSKKPTLYVFNHEKPPFLFLWDSEYKNQSIEF